MYRRKFRKMPTVIIGDLDSLSEATRAAGTRKGQCVVHVAEQDTNDLEKAIAYCACRQWKNPIIVGAVGKREDHMIGNIFRGLAHGLEIVTDRGRFMPVNGKKTLRTGKGAAVSIFAPDADTRMTSKGLEWPLDEVEFKNLYCATLNRASAASITVTSTKPVYVYIEEI